MVWVFFSLLSATGNFFELDIRVSQMELESTSILGKCMVKHISCFESVLVCAYIKIVTDISTNPLFTLPWYFDLALPAVATIAVSFVLNFSPITLFEHHPLSVTATLPTGVFPPFTVKKAIWKSNSEMRGSYVILA